MIHSIVEIMLALVLMSVVWDNAKLWKSNAKLWTRIRKLEKEIRSPQFGGEDGED